MGRKKKPMPASLPAKAPTQARIELDPDDYVLAARYARESGRSLTAWLRIVVTEELRRLKSREGRS